MKAFVTGGAGFIGSHVCERLLSLGCKVICLDKLDDFYSRSVKESNLSLCKKNPDFVFHEGDICDGALVGELFKEYCPDVVVHLAAQPGISRSFSDPSVTFKANIQGTTVILSQMVKNKITKLINISSSSVYDDSICGAFCEKLTPLRPKSPYALSKKLAEETCDFFSTQYGLSIITFRPFSVYGSRQRPDLVFSVFLKAILSDKSIYVHGDGQQTRDYTHVLDVVNGIIRGINRMDSTDVKHEVFNLGSSCPISINDVVKLFKEEFGFNVKNREAPKGLMLNTWADLSRSKEILGYVPQYGIYQELRSFMKNIRNS